jgi:hypothetical protein
MQKRHQFMAEASANPLILRLIGLRGFAKILRGTIASTLDMEPDEIVPSDNDVMQMEQADAQAAAQQQQQQQQGQEQPGQQQHPGKPPQKQLPAGKQQPPSPA